MDHHCGTPCSSTWLHVPVFTACACLYSLCLSVLHVPVLTPCAPCNTWQQALQHPRFTSMMHLLDPLVCVVRHVPAGAAASTLQVRDAGGGQQNSGRGARRGGGGHQAQRSENPAHGEGGSCCVGKVRWQAGAVCFWAVICALMVGLGVAEQDLAHAIQPT